MGKHVLFGYDGDDKSWWNLGYSRRGYPDLDCQDSEFWPVARFPSPPLRVLRKQSGRTRTRETHPGGWIWAFQFTLCLTSPCPWLLKGLYSYLCLLGCWLFLLFSHSTFLAVTDKSHPRLSPSLLRYCLCLIFDASAYLLGLKLLKRLSVSAELLLDDVLLHLSLMHSFKFFRYLCRAPQFPSVKLSFNPSSFSKPKYRAQCKIIQRMVYGRR